MARPSATEGFTQVGPSTECRPLQRLICCIWNVKDLWFVCVSLTLMPLTIISDTLFNEFVAIKEIDHSFVLHEGYCMDALYTDKIDYEQYTVPADKCKRLCMAKHTCNGFTAGSIYRLEPWNETLTFFGLSMEKPQYKNKVILYENQCTIWLNGACKSANELSWVASSTLKTHVSDIASRLADPLSATKLFWQNKARLLEQAWQVQVPVILLFAVAVAVLVNACLAICVTIYCFISSAPYGTMRFFRQIVSVKKGQPSQMFFYLALFACVVLESLLLIMFATGGLHHMILLSSPLVLLLNVLDLRKIHRDMYPTPKSMRECGDIFLKIDFKHSVAKAEDILENVENCVIAYHRADFPEPLQDFVGGDDKDVQTVIEIFKTFGPGQDEDNFGPIEGEWTRPGTSTLHKYFAFLFQAKAHLLVLFSLFLLLRATIIMIGTEVFVRYLGTPKAYPTVISYIPCLFIFQKAKRILGTLADNPYPYGSLQFFIESVIQKKKHRQFVNFAARVCLWMLMGWLTVAPAGLWAVHGFDGQVYSRYYVSTFGAAALCVINATQTRKVIENMYPSQKKVDPSNYDNLLFLKLTCTDITLPAEDILERVENGFVAKVIGESGSAEYLHGVVRPEDEDGIRGIYARFGKSVDDSSKSEQAKQQLSILEMPVCRNMAIVFVSLSCLACLAHYFVHGSALYEKLHSQ